MIKIIKIFPPIGIARLGNSKDSYFIGPEKVGDVVIPPDGFRDAAKLIKRQAARFRALGFDENDQLVKEFTSDDADIRWTVHLANTKAAAEWFHPKSDTNPKQRNADFSGDRNQLKLDPGSQSVGGRNSDFADLNKSRAQGMAQDLLEGKDLTRWSFAAKRRCSRSIPRNDSELHGMCPNRQKQG